MDDLSKAKEAYRKYLAGYGLTPTGINKAKFVKGEPNYWVEEYWTDEETGMTIQLCLSVADRPVVHY